MLSNTISSLKLETEYNGNYIIDTVKNIDNYEKKLKDLGIEYTKNKLSNNINQVESFIVNAGVKCSTELIQGDKDHSLGDILLEYQQRLDADLIMIMTKKEELSFSNDISVTARYIINNSEIPVMSIRPKESKHITGPTIAF